MTHIILLIQVSMLLSIYFNQSECAQFITYLEIKWYFSVKMNLKGPLSRGGQFKFHFYLRWQGNRGSSQSFHATSFSRDYRSIIPKHEAFNRDEMHGNTNTTWNKMTKLRVKRHVWHEIISRLSPLWKKVKFKATPTRGGYFKVHFDLEFWGNRGSSQDFHGAPFREIVK